jgi:hypothetical protein
MTFRRPSTGLVTVPNQQHSHPPASKRKVSRKRADEARQQLAAGGGLSHQERRQLRSVANARDALARRRRGEVRHIVIIAAGALAGMAIVGAALGLPSALEASSGQGMAGTFIVGNQPPCLNRRVGCLPSGIFRARDGVTIQHVAYAGSLPNFAPPGTSIPAVDPGGSNTAYPPRDSATWVHDVLWMVLVGAIVGSLLWLFPIGTGEREPSGADGALL